MKLHLYKHNYTSYCGFNILKYDYSGLASLEDCTCLKCLKYFIANKSSNYSNYKKIAKDRFSKLTYKGDFAKLIK